MLKLFYLKLISLLYYFEIILLEKLIVNKLFYLKNLSQINYF